MTLVGTDDGCHCSPLPPFPCPPHPAWRIPTYIYISMFLLHIYGIGSYLPRNGPEAINKLNKLIAL